MKLPGGVVIEEVAPRDGFQAEKQFIPTETKIKFIDMLSEAGLSYIQATSFVGPKAIPQMRDADEVMAKIQRRPGVCYSTLVPNLKGGERAVAAKADEVAVVISASESHNISNVRMTIVESLRQCEPILKLAHRHGLRARGGISTAFGCPFEGVVPEQKVVNLARSMVDLGAEVYDLGDTTGMAHAVQVQSLVATLKAKLPSVPLILHFHNTRGAGLANVLAGLEVGVTAFDASVGRLGGCPFAPGATGNICTQDLVHMLHQMGMETGINLDKLIACAKFIEKVVGYQLPGQVMKAGKNSDLHPFPPELQELRESKRRAMV